MYFLLLLLVILALLFAPQMWANHVLKKHARTREDFPGTGGEFATHLIRKLQLNEVQLEKTDSGDHYDPSERKVRLSADNHDRKSLTAIVTAAHEVGHAIQHHVNYRPLVWRTRMARLAWNAERAGAILIYAIPVIAAITRSPHASLFLLVAGVATMAISAVVHLVTLPVEFDASFNRALPVLEHGNYLGADDMRNAHRILLACALTYVAASLSGLLNIWRWIMIFRR